MISEYHSKCGVIKPGQRWLWLHNHNQPAYIVEVVKIYEHVDQDPEHQHKVDAKVVQIIASYLYQVGDIITYYFNSPPCFRFLEGQERPNA